MAVVWPPRPRGSVCMYVLCACSRVGPVVGPNGSCIQCCGLCGLFRCTGMYGATALHHTMSHMVSGTHRCLTHCRYADRSCLRPSIEVDYAGSAAAQWGPSAPISYGTEFSQLPQLGQWARAVPPAGAGRPVPTHCATGANFPRRRGPRCALDARVRAGTRRLFHARQHIDDRAHAGQHRADRSTLGRDKPRVDLRRRRCGAGVRLQQQCHDADSAAVAPARLRV